MHRIIRRLGTARRRGPLFAFVLAGAVTAAAIALDAQVPGPNVNMVSGISLPDGDPFLQRQNEPSGAVGTRNPLHVMAGANDYRTVDLPGLPDGEETGDAWLGIYKSFDGGQTWRSSLVPGYPQDQSPEGLSSPLKAFQAGADPTVRAGTNGLFYYSGIAFNRGTNGLGMLFLARYIDDNNASGKDTIRYLGTSVVASGTKNTFIDKPYMIVDQPRPGAKMCSIPMPGGVTPLKIAAGTIYISYVVFDGNDKNLHSKVMLTRSADCGVTWSKPSKVSEGPAVNQGVALAIDPVSGEVYLAWRQFRDKKHPNATKDAIFVARSKDIFHKDDRDEFRKDDRDESHKDDRDEFRKDDRDEREFREPMEFSDPVMAANGIPGFDQGDSTTTFRTNSYPTITVDGDGRVYLAWTERGWGPPSNIPPTNPGVPTGDARVIMTTSANGVRWTPRKPVEVTTRNGHQIMPVLTALAGKISLVYYDLREDVAGVFGQFVDDANSKSSRHTLDVRVLQADPADLPAFGPSVQVSRYLFGSLPGAKGAGAIRQLQFNVPNLPLYRLGKTPFIGDFIDIAGQTFVQDATGKWTFNVAPGGPAALHAFWTDNRDVRPPKNKDWTRYTPPTSPFTTVKCEAGTTGMRNSNIYTSLVTQGLRVGSPFNTRRLDPTVQRSFVVFAQNNTDLLKRFRLRITNQPTGGAASFMQFDPVTEVDANTPPRSTASRTVFVTSSDPTAAINVDVVEVEVPTVPGQTKPPVKTNGLTASIALNPDVTNPDVTNPDVTNSELLNPDVTNPDVTNPDVTNPDVTNPDVTNPDVTNAVVANPDVTNPDVTNPDVTNPDVTNPDVTNQALADGIKNGATPLDATWTLKNNGTVAGSFAIKPFIGKNAPAGTKQQLILHKSYKTPVTVGDDCVIKTVTQMVLVSNITDPTKLKDNPNPDPADESNGTVWLEPGQLAKVTLRVLPDPNTQLVQRIVTQSDGVTQTKVFVDPAFDPARDVAPVIQQVVVPPADVAVGITTPPPPTIPLIISTTALGDGVAMQPYDQTLASTGGVDQPPGRLWSLPSCAAPNTPGCLPAGLTMNAATGRIAGTPSVAGAFAFTVQVMDTATPPHVNTRDLFIRVAPFAVADSRTTNEDTLLTFAATDLLANDPPSAANASTLALVVTSVAPTPDTHGTVALGNGQITYNPAPNYNGPATFTYTSTLATTFDAPFGTPPYPVLTSTGAVSITVVPVNDAPTATAQTLSTNEDTALAVTLAGVDQETLPANLSVAITTPPSHGSLSAVAGHGVTYTPTANYNGADSFAFTVTDRGDPDNCGALGAACTAALTSVPAVVSITVVPVNDAPTFKAGADQAVFDNSGPQTIAVWARLISAGPPDEVGQTLTFQPTAADTSLFAVQPAIDATTGTLTYTPNNPIASGSTIVTVTLKDNGGTANGGVDTSAAQTFAITVTHRGPTATNDTATVFENRLVGIDVLANDTGSASSETLSVLSATPAGNGLALLCMPVPPSENVALWTGDGTTSDAWGGHNGAIHGGVTFAPGKVGRAFAFDGTSGYVSVPDNAALTPTTAISVGAWIYPTGVNAFAPIVFKGGQSTVSEGYSLEMTGDGTAVHFLLALPNGLAASNTSPVLLNQWSHVVGVYDGNSIGLIVNGVPTALRPASGAIVPSSNELRIGNNVVHPERFFQGLIDEPFIANVGLSPGDVSRTFDAGIAGVCRPEPTGAITGDASGLWAGSNASTTTTTTAPIQTRTKNDVFAFLLQQVDPAHLTATFIPRDPTTTITGDLTSTANGVLTYAVTAQIVEPGACNPNATFTGTFTIDTVNNTFAGNIGGLNSECKNESNVLTMVRETGSTGVIYMPDPEFNGSDAFAYTIGDGFGGTATATVNVTVTPVNQPPTFTAGPQTVTVSEDAPAQSIPWATNITAGPPNESGETVQFVLTQQFANNSLGGPLFSNAPSIDPSGVLTFQPAPNANGSAGFNVQLKDNGGTANGGQDTSQSRFLQIVVSAVNDQPIALAQSLSATEDTPKMFTLLATDVETPPFGLTYTIVSGPQHGSLSSGPGPNRTYTPLANYFGPDSFTFTVSDTGDPGNCASFSRPPQQGCAAALTSGPTSVSIAVSAVNDPPVAGDDTVTTAEDTPLSFPAANLTANDSPGPNEGDQTLTVTAVIGNAGTNGLVSLNGGTVVYTPDPDYNGPATFDYVVFDNGTTNGAADPRSTTGHVFVTVTEVNDPPVVVSDNKSVLANSVLSFPATDLTSNDSPGPSNESGQLLTVVSVMATAITHGTVTLNATTVTYAPEHGYFGPASFTYDVCDNGTTKSVPDPKCATGTVNVTVGQPLTITTLALPNGTQGQPYSQQTFATGGLPPYAWSIVSIPDHPEFDVPTGLTFATQGDGTGLVSGIPTIALQVRTFRLRVTDALGNSSTQDVCIHIDETSSSGLIANPASATNVAAALVGESVTISNVTYAGAGAALGTFSGGLNATGLSSGIVLSSGWVSNIDPPNNAPNKTAVNGTPGDADLGALAGGPTYDAAVLEFDFVVNDPSASVVKFDYVFASEEYNEFANTAFNDVFGFFLSGPNFPKANLALIPGTDPPVPVSINNLNGGNPFGTNAHHADLFINNEGGSIATQADGLTKVLTLQATVTPGQTYHLKIAITDVGDSAYDSWVLIKAHSLSAVCPLIP